MSNKNRGLGRGLSALMADIPAQPSTAEPVRADQTVPIERIVPNPNQPRRTFEAEPLEELAASIAEKGIIQPIIVRATAENRYEIVAGERRWRAAQKAQLHEVPVIVREFDDTEVLEVAIIENIQRADLNPVDEANGYKQLLERFGHTQEQLASALGKSRSHIANQMRLLTLPDTVQTLLAQGDLSAGHARALVGHPRAAELAAEIVKRSLSVRDVERMVKAGDTPTPKSKSGTQSVAKDADTIQIEADLSAHLKMKVKIEHKADTGRGTVVLNYKTLEQLDDVLRLLSGG